MVSNIMFPSRFDFWGLNLHFQVPTPNDAFTTMGLYELYEKLIQPCLTWTLLIQWWNPYQPIGQIDNKVHDPLLVTTSIVFPWNTPGLSKLIS